MSLMMMVGLPCHRFDITMTVGSKPCRIALANENRKLSRCRTTIGGTIAGHTTTAEPCARWPSGLRIPPELPTSRVLCRDVSSILVTTSMSTDTITTTTTTQPAALSSHQVYRTWVVFCSWCVQTLTSADWTFYRLWACLYKKQCCF